MFISINITSRHNMEASHTILTKSFRIQKPSASHKIQRKRTWINTWFYIKSIIIIIINQKQKYYAWNPAPFEILNIFILDILKPKLHRNNQDWFFLVYPCIMGRVGGYSEFQWAQWGHPITECVTPSPKEEKDNTLG